MDRISRIAAKITDYPHRTQGFAYDCGATAVLTVLQYYGYNNDNLNEQTVFDAIGTDTEGTSNQGIELGLQKLGMKFERVLSLEEIDKHLDEGHPVVVCACTYPNDWHYMALVSKDGDSYIVSDPWSVNLSRVPIEIFDKVWFDQPDEPTQRWGVAVIGDPRYHGGITTMDVKLASIAERVATRPIRIDRSEVERAIDRMIKRFQTANGGYWADNPDEPLRSQFAVEDHVSVRTVDGRDIDVIVQYRSQSSRGSDFILGGGSGKTVKTKKPAIVIYINGNYSSSVLTRSGGKFRGEAIQVLLHEITHQADVFTKPSGEITQSLKSEGDLDLKDYYNRPAEVKAYMREVFEEVKDHIDVFLPRFGMNESISRLIRWSDTWERISKHLTEENKKTVMKGVYQAVQDYMEEQKESKAANLTINESGRTIREANLTIRRSDPPKENWGSGGKFTREPARYGIYSGSDMVGMIVGREVGYMDIQAWSIRWKDDDGMFKELSTRKLPFKKLSDAKMWVLSNFEKMVEEVRGSKEASELLRVAKDILSVHIVVDEDYVRGLKRMMASDIRTLEDMATSPEAVVAMNSTINEVTAKWENVFYKVMLSKEMAELSQGGKNLKYFAKKLQGSAWSVVIALGSIRRYLGEWPQHWSRYRDSFEHEKKYIFDKIKREANIAYTDALSLARERPDEEKTFDFSERVTVGKFVLVPEGGLEEKKMKEAASLVSRAVSLIARAGFRDVLSRMVMKVSAISEPGLVAGQYYIEKDTINIPPLGMMVETMVHELGHRNWYRVLTNGDRGYWREAFHGNLIEITKEDVEEVVEYARKPFEVDKNLPGSIREAIAAYMARHADDPVAPYKAVYFKENMHHHDNFSFWEETWKKDLVGQRVMKNFVTDYANTNEKEAYAEVFMRYVMGKTIPPVVLHWFRQVSFHKD